jgi:GxxExxY protein
MNKIIDDELTYKIIGCAMKVVNTLGNGFQELIYHRALAIEFGNKQVDFENEFVMPLFYKGERIGTRRVDFCVERKISKSIIKTDKIIV